jgi:hypothetical protein
MSCHQPNPNSNLPEFSPTGVLLEVANSAHRIFAGRHNWLSPLTSEEERKQFIVRCGAWWNDCVGPAMDRVEAAWNEAQQCFQIAASHPAPPESASLESPDPTLSCLIGVPDGEARKHPCVPSATLR